MEYRAIKEFCNVSSSKRIFAEQYVDEGIPFYRQKEIIEKGMHQTIEEPIYISEETYNNIKTKFGAPQEDDLLITAVGVTLGIPYVVDDEVFYFKDGNLIWLSEFDKSVNSKYVYYWFSSSFGHDSIYMRAIGSAQPAITIDIVKKYKLLIPDRKVQDRIVEILSGYDQAIENNTKRIKTLEQMAENLYKEWFVRFRFPGHENAEFENGIPKGWKRVRLKDIACEVGKAVKKENREKYQHYLPIDCLPQHGMSISYEDSIVNAESSLVSFNSLNILFGAMRPYFHKVVMAPFSGLTRSTCFVIDAKDDIYRYYLYLLMYQVSTVDFANTISVGSTMPYVRWEDFKRMNTIKPDVATINLFNQQVKPLINCIILYSEQNKNLIKQRDVLLPRLMSGKLEV